MTLDELATIIGKELRTYGYDDRGNVFSNYDGCPWVDFPSVEIMHRGMLLSAAGRGKTLKEARRDLAQQLSGMRFVVWNMGNNFRTELQLPTITDDAPRQAAPTPTGLGGVTDAARRCTDALRELEAATADYRDLLERWATRQGD